MAVIYVEAICKYDKDQLWIGIAAKTQITWRELLSGFASNPYPWPLGHYFWPHY